MILLQTIFSLKRIHFHWLDLEFQIKTLRIERSIVMLLTENAFDTTACHSITQLHFKDITLVTILDGAFNGLEQLEGLKFENVPLKTIQTSVIIPCRYLKQIHIDNCWTFDLWLNRLTGVIRLKYLDTFYANRNDLGSEINNETFSGLIAVERILLPENRITFIGENAFSKRFMPKLKYIDLKQNLLRVVPSHFVEQFPFAAINVNLNENPWYCNCQLENIRKMAIQKLTSKSCNLYKNIKCSGPGKLAGRELVTLPNLCQHLNQEPTPPATMDSKNNDEFLKLKCDAWPYKTYRWLRKPAIKYFNVMTSPNGKSIHLVANPFPLNYVIISFVTNGSQFDDLQCIKSAKPESIPASDLEPNQNYRFCMLNDGSNFRSPFDCVSFYTQTGLTIKHLNWLSAKERYIIMILASSCLSAIFGFFMSFFIAKYFPKIIRKTMHQRRESLSGKSSCETKRM